MIVQTAVDPDSSLLYTNALLEHLALLQQATQVTITMFDITWRLKDICQSASVPNFDVHYIEQIFENIMPCSIATPLDCFWEGSKLLGPDYAVHIPGGGPNHVKWTNLNPNQLVNSMKQKQTNFDYYSLEDYFHRAGITSGYQEKPCLNPRDPECPQSAPNYNSTQPLDIGTHLTSGCYGFAAKYMHWPEELIVGGVSKNKLGHIRRAKALQSVVQLMDKHELHEFWADSYKIHHIGWSQEKASLILHSWQKRFAQEVERLMKSNMSSSYLFNTFSTATSNKGLMEHSKIDYFKLRIVLVVAGIYGWIVQSGLATLGVLLLASSTAAGLGVCSLLGLPMNLLSTHVLPFLSVGLAMREMFMILSMQNRNLTPSEILQRAGPSILTAALMQSATFLIAAIVPIPALRVFCLQCSILSIFHAAALLLIFPTLLALQVRCRKAAVPCFRNESKAAQPQNASNNNNNNNNDPELGANLLTAEIICQQKKSILSLFVNHYLVKIILQPVIKVLLCVVYLVLIAFCIFNGLKLEYDVRLSSFLPKSTQEHRYLEAQNEYFGFYNFFLVTRELEYPLNQPLLYEYHRSLTNVPHVLKDSNGGLNMNDFWLANFRDFLLDLQEEFDQNKSNNCVSRDGKWYSNATEKAVLAIKLLAQTGVVEFPVDKSQIFSKKLVVNNVIDRKAFYNYLSVWSCNDQMSYSSSRANLWPKPFQYYSSKSENDLKIPKSQPLVYTQMPFYLKNLRTTSKIMETLKQIKEISDSYNSRGLKNYPVGLIFAYFNQFLVLDRLLLAQLATTVIASNLIAAVLIKWTKLWCSLFSILAGLLLIGFLDISAMTGTMGAFHFIVISRNITLTLSGFLSALGNKEKRVKMSLEINADSILKGDIGLLICASVLATSQFEFIQYDIFTVVLISVCGSVVSSLIFFPVLLALFGPKEELQSLEHNDRISTPPPPPMPPPPAKTQTYPRTQRRNINSKTTREPSLTTITEESCNQSIVVEPQVTVEYTSPESSSSGPCGPYTTKVTATANIKVELVTPVYRSSKCSSKCHRTKCSRRQQQCKCCKQDSESSDSSAETETCSNS
ncbi:Hedgehog receptor [Oryctes borbonicus]|uniref:Hedgehog receptor n=1 Tax=Oryctes borbonicus TaxID=1629725 RepID=A0A0T6AYE3_9SCAR|nr:Hedgehog receptor [Oryctes borbonicus]